MTAAVDAAEDVLGCGWRHASWVRRVAVVGARSGAESLRTAAAQWSECTTIVRITAATIARDLLPPRREAMPMGGCEKAGPETVWAWRNPSAKRAFGGIISR